MRRVPDRQERLVGLFVVLGATIAIAPVDWVNERWSEADSRDPAAWGAGWLGDQLSAHPYFTVVTLLLGIMLSGGLVMLVLVILARQLAARLIPRGRPPGSEGRDEDPEL